MLHCRCLMVTLILQRAKCDNMDTQIWTHKVNLKDANPELAYNVLRCAHRDQQQASCKAVPHHEPESVAAWTHHAPVRDDI